MLQTYSSAKWASNLLPWGPLSSAETHTSKFHQLLLSITRKCHFLSIIYFFPLGEEDTKQPLPKWSGSDKCIRWSGSVTEQATTQYQIHKSWSRESGKRQWGRNAFAARILLILQHTQYENNVFTCILKIWKSAECTNCQQRKQTQQRNTHGTQNLQTWVQISILPIKNCFIFSKSLNYLVLTVPICKIEIISVLLSHTHLFLRVVENKMRLFL